MDISVQHTLEPVPQRVVLGKPALQHDRRVLDQAGELRTVFCFSFPSRYSMTSTSMLKPVTSWKPAVVIPVDFDQEIEVCVRINPRGCHRCLLNLKSSHDRGLYRC